jgi:hypothetical protein
VKSLEVRRREALYWISGLVWTLAILGFIVLIDDVPTSMDPTTLY